MGYSSAYGQCLWQRIKSAHCLERNDYDSISFHFSICAAAINQPIRPVDRPAIFIRLAAFAIHSGADQPPIFLPSGKTHSSSGKAVTSAGTRHLAVL